MSRPALPRTHAAAVAAVALLVLAGCTAPTIGQHEAERPPGVRENGVAAAPLLAAHERALADRSYTVTFRYAGPNRTVTTVLRVGRAHEHASATVRYRGPDGPRLDRFYVGDDCVFNAETTPNGTRERAYPRDAREIQQLQEALGTMGSVRSALRHADLRPVDTTGRHGRTLVVLAGNGTYTPRFHQYEPVRVRLLVSERGVVHRATVTDLRGTARSQWTLHAVGQTRVSRPAWTPRVENCSAA